MKTLSLLCALPLLLVCLATNAQSQAAKSDWMDLVVGHRDGATGAEVRSIEREEGTGKQRIVIAVPKLAYQADEIEEVLVLGRKPEESEPWFEEFTYEWVDALDEGHYGLVIRLSEDTNWPIRLFMQTGRLPVDIEEP